MSIYTDILSELGHPHVFLVPAEQMEHVEGLKMAGSDGMASGSYPIIALAPGLKGKRRKNVIYHEIAHHIFPHRPHWWVECFAERMAGGGGRGYFSKLYGHTVDEMPVRNELLKLSRKAVERFNKRKHE